jgi:hypothetical protein
MHGGEAGNFHFGFFKNQPDWAGWRQILKLNIEMCSEICRQVR